MLEHELAQEILPGASREPDGRVGQDQADLPVANYYCALSMAEQRALKR
jgi:hypothetical protein